MSWTEKIKEALRQLKDAVLVSEEEAKRRIAICESCPSKKFMKISRRCNYCKCFMDLKTKVKVFPLDPLKEEIHCPDKYW